jgi:hypothetical protein
MIKSGLIDDKIASVLPYNVVEQFEDLIEIYTGNSELSKEQIENVLDNTKNEYIQTFSK